ncbi:MAG TPA: hypothetical protein VH418_20970 [Solirubrobacteraceae bacterium]|jgi:hypothetical protein
MSDLTEEPGERFAATRRRLKAPGVLVRLILRDPHHVPERVTIFAVDRQADAARAWAEQARAAAPDSSPAELAEVQRRRTVGTARVDGAIAGTPFFIALVPAYVAFLWQEARLHLRVAALYGHDPADPHVAADFLVLRGVRADTGQALTGLADVRARPLPEKGARTPLRSWYRAVVNVLVLAGFLAPPEEGPARVSWIARAKQAVSFTLAGLIWLLTWVVPVTFMIVMSWACESDARRFGHRVTTHYGRPDEDAAAAVERADRTAPGNRAITFVRGVLVVLSVAIPLAFVASAVFAGKGPFGVNVPESAGALVALALVIGAGIAAVRG